MEISETTKTYIIEELEITSIGNLVAFTKSEVEDLKIRMRSIAECEHFKAYVSLFRYLGCIGMALTFHN